MYNTWRGRYNVNKYISTNKCYRTYTIYHGCFNSGHGVLVLLYQGGNGGIFGKHKGFAEHISLNCAIFFTISSSTSKWHLAASFVTENSKWKYIITHVYARANHSRSKILIFNRNSKSHERNHSTCIFPRVVILTHMFYWLEFESCLKFMQNSENVYVWKFMNK